MRKKVIFILAACLLPAAAAFAQTAQELDALLETEAISCAQAAYFVLAFVSDGESQSIDADIQKSAFEQAMANGWFKKGTKPEENATLGKLSFLIMKAFKMKSSLMYRIFPGPRYAFRTMVNRSLIQGTADPGMKVNGDRFLMILGNVLDAAEGKQ